MILAVNINHLKKLRTLKELVIKEGSPADITVGYGLCKIFQDNPEQIQEYAHKYTKEDIRFVKNMVGDKRTGRLSLLKLLPILKYHSAAEFKIYTRIWESMFYEFRSTYKRLLEAASQNLPVAKKVFQRTLTVAIISPDESDPFAYNVGVLEIPKLVWDNFHNSYIVSSSLYKNIYNSGIPEEFWVKREKVRSKIKNDREREYLLAALVYKITSKNPVALSYIEHIVSYLVNLPDDELENMHKKYCSDLV
jgi:hypothetical protein